jgi:hypothetical protein
MASRELVKPPVWDDARLEADRSRAVELFIEERVAEGSLRYLGVFDANLIRVKRLFRATTDLTDLSDGTAISDEPSLLSLARYLAGPPISGDDLDTLAGMKIAKRKRITKDLAQKAASVIEAAIDERRFPWLFTTPHRRPTNAERQIAIRWTAGLKTAQEVQMSRRSESSARQEAAVISLLEKLEFERLPIRPIGSTSVLERGKFSGEADVAGTKCDVPAALWDGRLLLVECKVSNSAVNSVKRLNRETVGKAGRWRDEFGTRAVPAAVLAGVFKWSNLKAAQTAGVTLFWEHDLESLAQFINATRDTR